MHIRRPEDIAAAVREARRVQKLSQTKLASKLEVNREWVSRLEAGEPGVSLGIVLRALNVLGLHLWIEEQNKDRSEDKPTNTSERKQRSPVSIDEVVDD